MRAYVALDLEATSTSPEEAKILEIAAQDAEGRNFHRYVATPEALEADHPAFHFTGIPFEEYQREKVPLERALREFLDFLGDRPLLGHNLLRYDLPLLKRTLREASLDLPPRSQPALDTLRLAHLVFPLVHERPRVPKWIVPAPPRGLTGYRLGDLYAHLTGAAPEGAHRARADVEATWRVLAGLVQVKLPAGVAQAWRALGLTEGELFADTPGLVKDLLATWCTSVRESRRGSSLPARVEPVLYEGRRLPHPSGLGENLLSERRQAQEQMFEEVEKALQGGHRVLLEAPTGTGKTKGYLYPALHLGERTWVATHTKVL